MSKGGRGSCESISFFSSSYAGLCREMLLWCRGANKMLVFKSVRRITLITSVDCGREHN